MPDDRFLHRRAGHSEKVNLLTDLEYRVWTQYLLSADDFGVMRGTQHPLQNDNDHLCCRPAKAVQRCLDALVKCGLIRRFEHQGKPYVYQHDWQAWQKVDFPRATTNPKPTAEALAGCDDATRALFDKHPGGSRKPRPERVPNDYREHPESVSPTRAGAPAKRLTAKATGERLPANGSGGAGGVESFPGDQWFADLKAAYPPDKVTSGQLTMTAFIDAVCSKGTPLATFTAMCVNLETQKRGHQWRVKGMIPRLDNWLRDGLWEQVHDEQAPVSEQLTPRTNRTLQAASNILRRSV